MFENNSQNCNVVSGSVDVFNINTSINAETSTNIPAKTNLQASNAVSWSY